MGKRRRHLWQHGNAMAFPRKSLPESRSNRATHLAVDNLLTTSMRKFATCRKGSTLYNSNSTSFIWTWADANNRKRESPQQSQQAEGHREEQDRMKQVDVSLSPTHTAFCRQDEEPAYVGHDWKTTAPLSMRWVHMLAVHFVETFRLWVQWQSQDSLHSFVWCKVSAGPTAWCSERNYGSFSQTKAAS